MNISGHTIGNKARPQILRRLIATAIQYFSKPRLIVRFGLMLIQNLTVEIHSLYRILCCGTTPYFFFQPLSSPES